MSTLALKVRDDIVELIRKDELVLPSLPEVALQIRRVADDIESNVDDLSQLVIQDPALSARIIKVANSPLMRASSEINDLNTAISRLGIDFSSNLALGLAMEQMFQATNDVVDKRIRQCWKHATDIAASAQVLAKHFTRIPCDQALLAGLVHQIGMLPVLSYAEDNEALLQDGMTLNLVLDKLHPSLGAHILKTWQFPEPLIETARNYHNPNRKADAVDICDVVQVATRQWLDTQTSDHPLAQVDDSELGSFKRMGIDQGEELEMDSIAIDIQEASAALN